MKKLFLPVVALMIATSAHGESRISASTSAAALNTTARVNFVINVPRILYLRVGDVGATVNEVQFTVGLAAPLNSLPIADQVYSAAIPPSLGTSTVTDDNGAADGAVDVQLWTNNGTANLNCAGAPLTSGTDTIPLTDITVTAGGTLAHPGGSLACASTPVGAAGVNSLTDTWTYAYAPASLPPTGSYTTQITYTAAQP